MLEAVEQAAHVVVDVGDHPEELGSVGVRDLAGVTGFVLGSDLEWDVGSVGRDTGEEGASAAGPFHPRNGLSEEHVGAVAAGLHEAAVVEDGGIEVGVFRGVAAGTGEGLADAAAAVDEDLVESAAIGLVGGFIAEVPFPEDAGGVAGGAKDVGEGDGGWREAFAFEDGVGDAVAEFVSARQQRAAGGGAGGADMEVDEPRAFAVEAVDVRRAEDGVAVAGEVAVPLVIGEDEDDVGPAIGDGGSDGRLHRVGNAGSLSKARPASDAQCHPQNPKPGSHAEHDTKGREACQRGRLGSCQPRLLTSATWRGRRTQRDGAWL